MGSARYLTELGTSLLYIERALKSDERSLIFWAKEKECRAMSELSKKRVRWSLIAIAQFKRACIFERFALERCKEKRVDQRNSLLETGDMAQYYLVSSQRSHKVCWGTTCGIYGAANTPPTLHLGCLLNFASRNFVCFFVSCIIQKRQQFCKIK
jgi:hypothetical protein